MGSGLASCRARSRADPCGNGGGNGCAGGLLCSIPTNNVAVQALEARLQADEIAIATLTRDVSELTQQTEELQKPLPQPSGAAKAP